MAVEGKSAPRSGQPHGRLLWPVLLIAAGVALMAANLGWLRTDALAGLARLWPLALVAAGVDILVRGRHRTFVVVLTLVVAGLLLALGPGRLGVLGGASPHPERVAQGLDGAQRAEVTLRPAVAALSVDGEAAAEGLATGTVDAWRGERVERSFDIRDGTAYLSIASEGGVGFFGGLSGRRWDLTLTGRVPLALRVETGVSASTLDLAEVRLEALDVTSGVGAITLTLPRHGGYDATVRTGVGAATIRIPREVTVRLEVRRGLGAVATDEAFARDGDVYVATGEATAGGRLDLRVEGGVGAIDIERIP